MGVLQSAKPIIVLCTRDRVRATAFYRDTLGLTESSEDQFATIFDVGGISMRLSTVEGFTPHEHTVLGFKVPDVADAVAALRRQGVTFNVYPNFGQDELGIWTAPGGSIRVAWFNDPDGNVLSVSNA